MSLQNLIVSECSIDIIREFVETHHYSASVKGLTPTHCFQVHLDGNLVGAAIFGIPAMRETIAKYSEGGRYSLVELRRFCLTNDTPRNTESKSLSLMFRILKKKGIDRVLSYADPNYGHVGTIYRATGFDYLGRTRDVNAVWWRGQRFHNRTSDEYRKWSTRTINRYQDHADKSKGLSASASALREALKNGTAVIKKEAGKFIYLKTLRSVEASA